MKTNLNKWLRWGAAGAFGLMLTLNVMVGLDFGKDKVLPSLTLMELGNQANAQSESNDDCDNWIWDCDALWREETTDAKCEVEYSYSLGVIGKTETYFGNVVKCVDGPNFICRDGCDAFNPY